MAKPQGPLKASLPCNRDHWRRLQALQARINDLEHRDWTPCNCPLDCPGPGCRTPTPIRQPHVPPRDLPRTPEGRSPQPSDPQRSGTGSGSSSRAGSGDRPGPGGPPESGSLPDIPGSCGVPGIPGGPLTDGPRALDGSLHPVVNLRTFERENAVVLAEARGAIPNIQLRRTGGTGTLRMSLTVHEDIMNYRSRLGYYGELYLATPGQKGQHIGFISAWRISRLSGQHPNGTPDWVSEWLRTGYRSDADDDLRGALRTLFNPNNGLPWDTIGNFNPDVLAQLRDDQSDIIFIPLIWISASVRTISCLPTVSNLPPNTNSILPTGFWPGPNHPCI